MWIQKSLQLRARPRGFHLITSEVVKQLPEIAELSTGIIQLFIQHTSASLSLNENADPTVREDFENLFNRIVPDGDALYRHRDEGDDDLPAHIKCSMLGSSLSLPITRGQIALGTWQGIYLGEHRNHGGPRRLIATLFGE
ncbi:secondary thiamine-phosphate synthase enzyme YjbQ [Spongiibacter sp.]|uniref:secondary thiamine-phosphate synthase enzyme YjbQ n=1 Tax=Spongiibacter sp. TaxID=2024860 RepID=UPI00356340FB